MKLSGERCARIEKGHKPLGASEAAVLSKEVPGWSMKAGAIEREYRFKGFDEAMEFVNAVASIAAAEDHHPDILVSYNRVRLTLTTHKAGGLTRNDFIVASKIDSLGFIE